MLTHSADYWAAFRAWWDANSAHLIWYVALSLCSYAATRLAFRVLRRSARTRARRSARLSASLTPMIVPTAPAVKPAPIAVKLPRHADRAGAVVSIPYPPTFSALPEQTERIGRVVAQVIGGEWEESHDYANGTLRFVRKAPAPKLPKSAAFRDDGGPVDQIPFAVDAHGNTLHIELTDKTPHVLIAASTGWGKTSTLSVIISWVASRGGLVDVVDPKRIGFLAFANLPSVAIHTDIEDMVDTIRRYKADMLSRYAAIEREGLGALQDRARFPIRVLVLDEMGSLIAMLDQYWKEIKEKGQPARNPWLTDILMILWQGRAAGMHVVTAAQQANAQVLINSDSRDQYALKIAAGPQSINSWRMMFGEVSLRKSDPVKGRAIAGIGPGSLVDVQLVRIGDDQARELALSGLGSHAVYAAELARRMETLSAPLHVVREAPEATPVSVRDLAPQVVPLPQEEGQARPVGRPPAEDREPVPLVCKCGAVRQTRAASGSRQRCRECRAWVRVPVRQRDAQATEGAFLADLSDSLANPPEEVRAAMERNRAHGAG